MSKEFTQPQNRVLTEIFRKLNYFHDGNLNEKLFYCALPSDIKCIKGFNLIKPNTTEVPRVLNWYSLTTEGKKFFKAYITKNKLSPHLNLQIFEGKYVKQFDRSKLG